jgi:antirestriction protein ArdC/phage/plasmid primase-like uncharacterized protein
MSDANPKQSFHEEIAERLIEQLRAGTAPWQRPWVAGQGADGLPMNPTTGNRYKGANAVVLLMQGRDDPRWMTYAQAQAAGAQVRRHEKGTTCQKWIFSQEQAKRDENGKPVVGADGKPERVTVQLERPILSLFKVFNAEQIDGLPPLEKRTLDWDPIKRAEDILSASGAQIYHGDQARAYYSPTRDEVHLPAKENFPSAGNYYATALHELAHWTGHETRLDRDLGNPFGSEGYAKEELRAEIASMILGRELGIGHDPEQHAAYVGSWIKVLQDDPLEIFRAAAEAEKIQGYMLAFEQKQVQDQKTQHAITEDQGISMQQQPEAQQSTVTPADSGRQAEDKSHPVPNAWHGEACRVFDEEMSKRMGGPYSQAQELYSNKEHARERIEDFHWDGRTPTEAEKLEEKELQSAIDEAESWLNENVYLNPTIKEKMYPTVSGRTINFDDDIVAYLKEMEATFESQELREAKIEPLAQAEGGRQYISVPFKDKDEAKELGAKWDRAKRSWYVPPGADAAVFDKWTAKPPAQENQPDSPTPLVDPDIDKWGDQQPRIEAPADSSTTSDSPDAEREIAPQAEGRQFLAVPYGERTAAKAAGARWDPAAKSWYAGPEADPDKIQRWAIDPAKAEQMPAMDPTEEFREALMQIGCDPDRFLEKGQRHPIMDGKKHRIAVVSDKGRELSGTYIGHLDGIKPAGYAKNHRSGIDITWKAKGYSSTPEQQAQLRAQAAEVQARRAAEQDRAQKAAQARVQGQIAQATPLQSPTPYLVGKGVTNVKPGLFTDSTGKDTFVPAYDADGTVWTMQYVKEDGTKRYAKDGKKEGCFHVVGGFDKLNDVPAIVLSEGLATAYSVSEGIDQATVAVFDAANLEVVAKALHAKYPEKPIVIAGDDDLATEKKEGINPGREYARKAAAAVNGKTVFPVFAPGEQSTDNKLFTDFNDLATRSQLGPDAVRRQVKAVVDEAVRQHRMADGIDDATQNVSLSTVDTAQALRTEKATIEQQTISQVQLARKAPTQEAMRARQSTTADMSQQLDRKEEREGLAHPDEQPEAGQKRSRVQRQARSISR